MFQLLQFYKYTAIENPMRFKRQHLKKLREIGMKGRILIGDEGINASLGGTKEQCAKYEAFFLADPQFSDTMIKYECAHDMPFAKTQIKIKKEVCHFGKDVDLAKVGKYIEPEALKKLYDDEEDFVIIDARNDYESKIGKFKNAVCPDIKTFRDFPKVVEDFKQYKDKKIVLYCTGGIRCEKASAYMVEQGFTDINHIHGGILRYIEKCPGTYWEGANFVFDKRMSTTQGSPITNCVRCDVKSDLMVNCSLIACDKKTVMCLDCQRKNAKCCSEVCETTFHEVRQQKAEEKKQISSA